MQSELRPFLIFVALAAACSSKAGSDLFGDAPNGPTSGTGAQSSSAGSSAANGGMLNGGNGATGGGGSSATPGAGSTTGGVASQGDAGEANVPSDAGAASGDAGSPPVVPVDPVCGNGKLEEGEQCDDAKHAGADGCSNDCTVNCSDFGEGTLESEDHHCYNGYDSSDWPGSQEACVAKGAHLATISSKAENDLADSFVNNSKFIGASEVVDIMSDAQGTYAWLTGEPFTYTNWAGGQPDRAESRCNPNLNNPKCYQHCAYMMGDGKWADQRCDMVDGYICEWEPAGK